MLKHVVVGTVSLMWSASVGAETITVCLDGSCDFTSIQAAIDVATSGDVIEISGETYLLEATIDTAGKALTLQGAIDSSGRPLTRLDGQGVRRVLYAYYSTSDIVLENLVIQNGYSLPGDGSTSSGNGAGMLVRGAAALVNCSFVANRAFDSALYVYDGTCTVADCRFIGNLIPALGYGGAFRIERGTCTVTSCEFTANEASTGGAISIGRVSGVIGPDSVLVKSCVFSDNLARYTGGAINVVNCQSLSILQSDFSRNTIQFDPGAGGAIYLQDRYNSSLDGFLVEGCSFRSNAAHLGGAVACEADTNLRGCVFISNTALESAIESGGGGVFLGGGEYTFQAYLENCSFEENLSAGPGGGIRMSEDRPCTAEIVDCTFRSNESSNGSGGGAKIRWLGSMTSCVFQDNRATHGAGLQLGGVGGNLEGYTYPLHGCIFEGNVASQSGGGLNIDCDLYPFCGGAVSTLSFELDACVFRNNTSSGTKSDSGSGIYWSALRDGLCAGSGTLTIVDSTICGNQPSGSQIGGDQWIDGSGNCVSDECPGCITDDCPEWPYECSKDDQAYYVTVGDGPASLQLAIDVIPEGWAIEIGPGTYLLDATIDTHGKPVIVRGSVDSETGDPLTLLDGGGVRRVVQCINGEGPDTVLENLKIQNGYTTESGGGMYNRGSSPTVRNCIFRSNNSDTRSPVDQGGGGMSNEWGSSPALIEVSFLDNITSGRGGAIRNAINSAPVLIDCTFLDNVAALSGGGMYNNDFSSPQLADCLFQGNYAHTAGGMHNSNSSDFITLTRCILTENYAEFAGGMYNSSIIPPSMADTVICGNAQGQIWGYDGDYNDLGGNCIDEDCTRCKTGDCLADLNLDAVVNGADLALFLAGWGCALPADCLGDIDGSGVVDGADLTLILSAWGSCEG